MTAEVYESDHLIMADMLSISATLEEVAEKYSITIPQLTLSSLETIRSKLAISPKTLLTRTMLASVDAYEQLSTRLGKIV